VEEKELEKENQETEASEEKEAKASETDKETEKSEDAGKKEKAPEKKKDPKDEKIDELNDKLRRSMAEFDNYRKRTDKEKSAMYEIGAKIQEMTGQEIRVTVPGHMQRGGTPVPYDRVLSTRIGAHAADMIKNNEFGKLVVVKNNVITDIPLAESAGKLKYVDPQSDIVKEAKLIGISFGD